jgi:DNA polymerase-3 subunit alpha
MITDTMAGNSYTALHLHDYWSQLDGASSPEEYMVRAKELGMTHLSQTNHGTLSGDRHFKRAAEDAGIIPIIGIEAYISATDRFDKRSNAKREDGTSAFNHITLLALNKNGYENLSRMSEIAWTEGFYQKPRIDIKLLEEHSDDIVVLSGCLNGLICKAIENDDIETATRIAEHLKSVLGDRFYIEVQSHNPKQMNHSLLDLADSMGIQPVMASDCHYSNPEDLWIEETMLILSMAPKRDFDADLSKMDGMSILEKYNFLYPDRKMTFQDLQLYLRSYQEESDKFAAQDITRTDIFENTNIIASRVEEYELATNVDLLPSTKADPNGVLLKLVRQGLKRRGLESSEYIKRAESELREIFASDQSKYFLVVAEMATWTKRAGIMTGFGRGSAAGSLVNYALGITEVDPIKHNLLFARFINAGSAEYDPQFAPV